MSAFPITSVTLIAKIKNLAPGEDSAAWVRFWDTYQSAIRAFAALKGGEQNADDIVMTVLGKLVDVLRSGQYTPEKGSFHSYLATMIVNEVHMAHRKDVVRQVDKRIPIDSPVGGDEGKTVADTLAVGDKFTIAAVDYPRHGRLGYSVRAGQGTFRSCARTKAFCGR